MMDVVISGVGEAGIGRSTDRTALQLQAEAASIAAADAGIELASIDAVFSSKTSDLGPGDRPAMEVAEYLGIRPSYMDSTLAGGAAPVLQVMHAVAAIRAGFCTRALITYGSTQASSRQRRLGGHRREGDVTRQFEQAASLPAPIGIAALAARRHMSEFGTTSEQLASVAVSQRRWAQLNPEALRRAPLTVADVLASPMIADPLHRDDICMVSDGAGAVIVQRGDSKSGQALIKGFGEAHSHFSVLASLPLTSTVAVDSSRRAFEMAGVTHEDIDLLQIYDAFTILPLVLLGDLGFAERGSVGELVASGAMAPGGRLPMNTQGGGLSHCHPGVYGIFLVIEAVRQLRRQAGDRQVDSTLALVQASGGGAFGGSQATLILGRS